MIKRKYRTAEIAVSSLSKKGNGVGSYLRPDGTTLHAEVPFTIPGDIVRAQLLRKRSNCYSSRLEEILSPSPDRTASRCIHFGTCGGCRLQQMSYERQVHYKQIYIEQCFAGILPPDIEIKPMVLCHSPWHYRNKMEYSFSQDAAGNQYLGLVAEGSKGRVLNITECHLTNSWFIETLQNVRTWWKHSDLLAYHPAKNRGSLRTLTLREGMRSGDRMAILTVSGNPDFSLKKSHLDGFVEAVRAAAEPLASDAKLSIFLRIQQIGKGMATNFYEMLLFGPDHIREILHISVGDEKQTLQFHISPAAFFQPNTAQAELLYSTALRLAEIAPGSVVYDLYCGTGSLGLSVAHRAKQVIGIEIFPEAVLDARTNADLNKCTNVQFFAGNVRDLLKTFPEKGIPRPDVVMVDPPRPGLEAEAISQIIEMSPAKIVYVSCNPATQAPNVAEFLRHGYRVSAVQPVDQFPQTAHVENIVILKQQVTEN